MLLPAGKCGEDFPERASFFSLVDQYVIFPTWLLNSTLATKPKWALRRGPSPHLKAALFKGSGTFTKAVDSHTSILDR
jgi:hypothetical protein